MAKEKTNIEHLRDIHKEMSEIVPTLVSEAEEFLDAIAIELGEDKKGEDDWEDKSLMKQIETKDEEIKELKDKIEDMEGDSLFVGLDTVYISLEKGNLLVQQRIDAFMKELRREFCVSEVSF